MQLGDCEVLSFCLGPPKWLLATTLQHFLFYHSKAQLALALIRGNFEGKQFGFFCTIFGVGTVPMSRRLA